MSTDHSPTSCENADLEHISSLIDGELEPRRLLEIIDRIADSPNCRTFYRKARALSGLVAAAEPTAQTRAPRAVWSAIAAEAGLDSNLVTGTVVRPQAAKDEGPHARRSTRHRWLAPLKSPGFTRAFATAIVVLAVAGLTWIGLRDRGFDLSIGPAGEVASAGREAGQQVILGSNEHMNDQRFVDLTVEILQADRRYRRELLRLISSIEQSSDGPAEGLSEGLSGRKEGSRSTDGIELEALSGKSSSARVRVPMW